MTDLWPQIAKLRTHIAWLGESGRMDFWRSDALTPDGGGAMLAGLLPKTAAWAGLQVAWACAAIVESRQVIARDAITLFRLGPEIDHQLGTWLRQQKRQAASSAGLTPDQGSFATAELALSAWKLVPPGVMGAARRFQPPPGAESVSMGVVPAKSLAEPEGLLRAAERLTVGYLFSSRGAPVIPFLEPN